MGQTSVLTETSLKTFSKTPRISIFAGPSGGHLFPALAYAECLKKRVPGIRISLVTSEKGRALVSDFEPGLFEEIFFLPNFPFVGGNLLRLFGFLLELPIVFFRSWDYLNKTHPDLCVGFGSYVSFPPVFLAHFRKIPTLIHEQNVCPGKANQKLAPWVKQVTASFETTHFESKVAKWTCVGLPIRSKLVLAAEKLQKTANAEDSKVRFLIMGGSQGAQKINRVWMQLLELLSPEEKSKIAVIHITGKNDFQQVSEAYVRSGIDSQVYSFTARMEEHYGSSDIALCRAGANSLFELALFGVSAIVIPYPGADGHQLANAKYFEKKNAAVVCEDKQLTPEWLLNQVRQWIESPELRKKMSKQMKTIAVKNADERLVDLSLEMLS